MIVVAASGVNGFVCSFFVELLSMMMLMTMQTTFTMMMAMMMMMASATNTIVFYHILQARDVNSVHLLI